MKKIKAKDLKARNRMIGHERVPSFGSVLTITEVKIVRDKNYDEGKPHVWFVGKDEKGVRHTSDYYPLDATIYLES